MNITVAEPGEADALTTIAFAAKGHWGYPLHWLESWRSVLTLTPGYVATHDTYAARVGDSIVGFSSLERDGAILRLEHLWVSPGHMGGGVGRALFRHAQQRASALGFTHLEAEADPHAAGFYERMGAEQVRATVSSIAGQERILPVFVCRT